jgi:hypothetical protein
MSFEISRGVPIPESTRGENYPFGELEPGDSFAVDVKKRKSIQAGVSRYQRNHEGTEFVTRTMEDGTVRIWRTK